MLPEKSILASNCLNRISQLNSCIIKFLESGIYLGIERLEKSLYYLEKSYLSLELWNKSLFEIDGNMYGSVSAKSNKKRKIKRWSKSLNSRAYQKLLADDPISSINTLYKSAIVPISIINPKSPNDKEVDKRLSTLDDYFLIKENLKSPENPQATNIFDKGTNIRKNLMEQFDDYTAKTKKRSNTLPWSELKSLLRELGDSKPLKSEPLKCLPKQFSKRSFIPDLRSTRRSSRRLRQSVIDEIWENS